MKALLVLTTLLFTAAFTLADDAPVSASGTVVKTEAHSGKDIFMANKCSMCHSIETQGIKAEMEPEEGEAKDEDDPVPPDLSNVGSQQEAAWISGFLMKKETLNEKKHPKKFTGTEEELNELAGWLASLKKEEPKTGSSK